MAKLVVLRWREDAVGFTGWDSSARSELKRRLKRAINSSPGSLKQVAHQILAKQLVTLEEVKEAEVASLRQILETMGADVSAERGATQ